MPSVLLYRKTVLTFANQFKEICELEPHTVIVAQLVRALVCGSRGRRFEPGLSPKTPPRRGFFIESNSFGMPFATNTTN